MKTSFKVVIFDLGKVLIPVDKGYLIGRASELLGIPQEKIKDAWSSHQSDLTTGKLSVANFYENLAEECDVRLRLPADQAVKELYTYFEDATLTDEMFLLIQSLQQQYTVVVLTNTEVETGKIFAEGMVANTVGHVYASSQLHMKKPDREIYEYVYNNLVVTPQECFFIDDLEENVVGAQKTGMRAVVYTDHETLVRALVKEGILEE